jgi:glycyl-tRNA synthetase (class II)
VGEDIRRDHFVTVRERSSLQVRVESQRVQPVLRAHAVHLA